MRLFKYGALAIVFFVLPIGNASAGLIQVGQWKVSYYPTKSNQKVKPVQTAGKLYKISNMCLQADHSWYSTDELTAISPVALQGHWEQSGNLVYLHLNGGEATTYGGINQGGVLISPYSTMMSGYWQEWGDQKNTDNNYFTVTWDFVKETCEPLPN